MKINSNEEITSIKSPSRRKFVLRIGAWSFLAAIAASIKLPVPMRKNIIACEPGNQSKKIKMLTQDGKLVEVDESLISANRKKITNRELQHWIKNKKASK
jgi:hypothetical protein